MRSTKESLYDKRVISTYVLDIMHNFYSYKEISHLTGIPISMISRYLRRRTIPSEKMANKIIKKFIQNKNIIRRFINLLQEEPDLLYTQKVSEIISLIIVNNYADLLNKIDFIIGFSDPTILIATKLSERGQKDILILHFAPMVPYLNADCFSLTSSRFMLYVCAKKGYRTRYRSLKALLLYPLIIPIELASDIKTRLIQELRLSTLKVIALSCRDEKEIAENKDFTCISERDDRGFKH
jgi:transcriptional regulator with XRE-family HTH domain